MSMLACRNERKGMVDSRKGSRDCLEWKGGLLVSGEMPAGSVLGVCFGYSVTRGGCQLSPFRNVQLSHIRPLVRTLMESASSPGGAWKASFSAEGVAKRQSEGLNFPTTTDFDREA